MSNRFIVNLIIFIILTGIVIFLARHPASTSLGQPPAPHPNTGMYPNASLTPGAVFTNVTTQQVCQKGYTKTVRDVPTSEKRLVYQEYGVSYPEPTGMYEVDHFIPLALGGSNDIHNLWLEPANPKPGFHEKDVVEYYLYRQVCSGNESLSQAQNDIKTDWYAVYQNRISKSFIDSYHATFANE